METTENKVFLTVHGHFYQPPRENPWLEAIEQQDSALPFHMIGMKELIVNVIIQIQYPK